MVRCLQLVCAFGCVLSLTGCLGQAGIGAFLLTSMLVLLGSIACVPSLSTKDAGTDDDAGPVLDGGAPADAGSPSDAGPGAGNPVDAGDSTDAGVPADAATIVDGGAPADAGPVGSTGTPDAGASTDTCDGTWQQACSPQGELVQECCPAGVACNYLPYQICEDGSCVLDFSESTCLEAPVDAGSARDAGTIADAGTPDTGCDGTWQTACSLSGELVQQCCPAGVACNYLPYQICDDGSCVLDGPNSTCRETAPDAGPGGDAGIRADAGDAGAGCDGTWQTACSSRGELVQQCCPAGVACNYLPYQVCDDGSCVMGGPESMCRESMTDAGALPDAGNSEDAGATDAGCSGTWSAACAPNGEIVQQCCPAGVACNYLPYQVCEDGSCATLDQECTAR